MQRLNPTSATTAGPFARLIRWLDIDPERMRVMRGLYPYVWPTDRPDLQRTVMLSLGLMLIAKVVTVLMPYTFKWATDALVAIVRRSRAGRRNAVGWLIAAPRRRHARSTASCAS